MNGTEFFRVNTEDISRSRIDAAYFLMSPERRKKCDSFLRESDKKLCIVSDMIVREKLSEKLGISPVKLQFLYNENGKPFLEGNQVYFSISHAGTYAAVAINEKHPVGIDIEEIRPVNFRMLPYFCTDKDMEFIFGAKSLGKGLIEDKFILERVFRVWTYKEAYVKSIGGRLVGTAQTVSFDEAKCYESVFGEYRQCIVITE